MRLPVLLAAIAIAVAACLMPSTTLDEARAVEIARRHAGPVDALVAAKIVRAADAGDGAALGLPRDTPVWRIIFRSSEVRPCGPAPGGHVCRIDSKTVILDASTGAFVTMSESGSTQ